MVRTKVINGIKWERPTIPLFHFSTPNHKREYTFADGGKFFVHIREWTWQFGYIYYVTITKPSLCTGRMAKRVFSEREIMLYMNMLTVSKQGKAA